MCWNVFELVLKAVGLQTSDVSFLKILCNFYPCWFCMFLYSQQHVASYSQPKMIFWKLLSSLFLHFRPITFLHALLLWCMIPMDICLTFYKKQVTANINELRLDLLWCELASDGWCKQEGWWVLFLLHDELHHIIHETMVCPSEYQRLFSKQPHGKYSLLSFSKKWELQ